MPLTRPVVAVGPHDLVADSAAIHPATAPVRQRNPDSVPGHNTPGRVAHGVDEQRRAGSAPPNLARSLAIAVQIPNACDVGTPIAVLVIDQPALPEVSRGRWLTLYRGTE